MTDTTTAAPPVDTRQFTPNEIAVGVAKALTHHADHISDRWHAVIAHHGVELAEDGAFTITTEGGQTFHLAVTQAAAQQREARAEAEARPHDSEKPDGVVYVVEGEEHGALYAAASAALARDWIATYGPDSYPGVDLTVTALAVER